MSSMYSISTEPNIFLSLHGGSSSVWQNVCRLCVQFTIRLTGLPRSWQRAFTAATGLGLHEVNQVAYLKMQACHSDDSSWCAVIDHR
jgi:hypothetical protein